jgi:hypothetical protein
MFSFETLSWEPHPFAPYRGRARYGLPNGYTVSVVYGSGLYGDGEETFEVAILDPHTEKLIPLDDYGYCDTVAAWCSPADVEALVARIAALPQVGS